MTQETDALVKLLREAFPYLRQVNHRAMMEESSNAAVGNLCDRIESHLTTPTAATLAAFEECAGICDRLAAFFGDTPDAVLHPLHKRERESYRLCADEIRARAAEIKEGK